MMDDYVSRIILRRCELCGIKSYYSERIYDIDLGLSMELLYPDDVFYNFCVPCRRRMELPSDIKRFFELEEKKEKIMQEWWERIEE